MPTRLWGDIQRARYGRFPDAIGEDDIARCFHLDERDQAIITELRGAHTPSRFPRLSPAEDSGLCATPIPNRTFATPYVSRPFLSHARSLFAAAAPASGARMRSFGVHWGGIPPYRYCAPCL